MPAFRSTVYDYGRLGRAQFRFPTASRLSTEGVGTFVATDYLEPQVKLDYATGAGANRYAGWDRFGRIVDLLWQGYGAESSSSSAEPPGLVHLQYGYDRASNRTHRADLIAQFYEKDFDELYEYDGLHRLKKFHPAERHNIWDFWREFSPTTVREPSIWPRTDLRDHVAQSGSHPD